MWETNIHLGRFCLLVYKEGIPQATFDPEFTVYSAGNSIKHAQVLRYGLPNTWLNEITLTGKVINPLTMATKMLLSKLTSNRGACNRKYLFSCTYVCRASGTAQPHAVGVWVGWSSSAPHVILLGIVETQDVLTATQKCKRASQNTGVDLKPLPSSCQLASHWPKKIMWPIPTPVRLKNILHLKWGEPQQFSHGKGVGWRIGNKNASSKNNMNSLLNTNTVTCLFSYLVGLERKTQEIRQKERGKVGSRNV